MTIAEVSIEPVGTGSTSVSDIIAASVGVLKNQPDIKFDVTAMGTIIQGDRSRIFSLVEKMEDACFRAGAERCVCNIRLDDRRDKAMSMDQMKQEVQHQIGLH